MWPGMSMEIHMKKTFFCVPPFPPSCKYEIVACASYIVASSFTSSPRPTSARELWNMAAAYGAARSALASFPRYREVVK